MVCVVSNDSLISVFGSSCISYLPSGRSLVSISRFFHRVSMRAFCWYVLSWLMMILLLGEIVFISSLRRIVTVCFSQFVVAGLICLGSLSPWTISE